MKLCKIFILISFLACTQAFAQSKTTYIRLTFDNDSISISKPVKYLWERKVLPEDTCWAQQSYDGKQWDSVPELPRLIKVGIALAGGGDRGIAHIGVLRALEENNIPIHAIAGTSMGAIIGGLYVCGYDIDTLKWIVINDIDWRGIFSDQAPRQYLPIWERLREKPREPGLNWDIIWDFGFWPPKKWLPTTFKYKAGAGMITAQKFTDEIAKRTLKSDYLAGFNFDSLSVPYGAMLVNMATKKSELKRKGTISTAARASGSLPMVFEPMKINGVPYIDGGVIDNLPVDAFYRFDSIRAPDNTMQVIGEDSISHDYDYIIAVYPSKRKNARNIVEKEPQLSDPLGIGINVINKIIMIARNYYDWESWDSAHAKIDVDVTGDFDFSPVKLEDKIRKGYDSAFKEICQIKKEIAAKEESLGLSQRIRKLKKKIHPDCSATTYEILQIKKEIAAKEESLGLSQQTQQIYRVSGIKLVIDNIEMWEGEEKEKILKAIRVKEGSYVEEIDICDALKRVNDLGDFEHVEAKMENLKENCTLTFDVKKKKNFRNVEDIVKNIHFRFVCVHKVKQDVKDVVSEKVRDYIKKKKRVLGFNEIKNLVETNFVEQGFISPRVHSVEFNPLNENGGSLTVDINEGKHLRSIKVSCGNSTNVNVKTKQAIEDYFVKNSKPYGPQQILKAAENIYRGFFLKTISVEGFEDTSLLIAAEKKSTHTLEFPSIVLENVEGISLFGEARAREWFGLSPYINITKNFTLKRAQELPHGTSFGGGFQRLNYRWNYLLFVPEIKAHMKRMSFSSADTNIYDTQQDEFNAHLALPIYRGNNMVLLPGVEALRIETYSTDEKRSWWDIFPLSSEDFESVAWCREFRFRYDDLDRIVFPEKGFMVNVDGKIDGLISFNPNSIQWARARAKILYVPIRFRIQGKATTVLTLRGFASLYTEDTPLCQRYSLGGFTPIGSYQLRRFDSEDLIGYERNEFMEPVMWKLGGSLRISICEMSPLDLRINVYLIGSYDIARAVPELKDFFSGGDLKQCPSIGFYLDTSYLNIGFVLKGKQDRFLDNFHLSLVYYGLGF